MMGHLFLLSFFQDCWKWLDRVDTSLFLKINTQWTNPFLDRVYPWWRDANTWFPIYLFFILFALMNFGKKAYLWILFVILTVTLTDQASSNLIKNFVSRPRPCQDMNLIVNARLLLDHCPNSFSFPSSHATNHFGFAMFIFITLQPMLKKWGYLFFLWAATISYGQVYVGVHYPIDISFGTLLGCCLGYLTGTLFNKKIGLPFADFGIQLQ